MRGINILGILVGIYLLLRSYLLIKRKEEDLLNLFIWVFIGTGLIITGLFPSVFDYIMSLLGMETRAYTMFVIAILLAYLLLFRIFQAIRRLDSAISKLNEEVSILRSRPTSEGFESESSPRA